MLHDVALLPARGSPLPTFTQPRHVLGSYSPFVGVRYYRVLDDLDVSEGRNKIGAVGWRVESMSGRENWEVIRPSSREAS